MSVHLAIHWTATTIIAAVTSLAAAIPFTGAAASYIGLIVCSAVCLIGIATAPNTSRKERP